MGFIRQLTLTMLALGVFAAAPVLGSGLPEPVRAALAEAGIPESSASVWVAPVEGRVPALSHNAGVPMNPASVMKLVTAFAVLDRFGPAHTWSTRIGHTGTLHPDGRLQGDLVLASAGDPVMSYERLWKLLRRVRVLGVSEIEGDIVLDGSALRLPEHDPFAFDGRGLRPYNSGPHGFLLHFNTLQLLLHPADTAGSAVGVIPTPPLRGLEIENRLMTTDGPCGVWFRNLDARLEADSDTPRLILEGSLPTDCGPRPWGASPFQPEAFAEAAVAALWGEAGGVLRGRVRHGVADDAAVSPLMADDSRALSEIVREMNKWSSNVIARQLLATLGADNPGSADMVAEGARIARTRFEAAGIGTEGLLIENGAGLSRIERIRADRLGEMLLHVWRQPYMPDFIAALPQAGVDGTAHQRLRRSPALGQAHVKTGTINGVRAIAGYVLDRNARRHVIVMMVNDSRAVASTAAQDALIEWVWAAP